MVDLPSINPLSVYGFIFLPIYPRSYCAYISQVNNKNKELHKAWFSSFFHWPNTIENNCSFWNFLYRVVVAARCLRNVLKLSLEAWGHTLSTGKNDCCVLEWAHYFNDFKNCWMFLSQRTLYKLLEPISIFVIVDFVVCKYAFHTCLLVQKKSLSLIDPFKPCRTVLCLERIGLRTWQIKVCTFPKKSTSCLQWKQ